MNSLTTSHIVFICFLVFVLVVTPFAYATDYGPIEDAQLNRMAGAAVLAAIGMGFGLAILLTMHESKSLNKKR